MKSFKGFLLTEAFNIAIVDPDELPDEVSTKQDTTQLKALFNFLKGISDEDIPIIGGTAGDSGKIKIQTAYETATSTSREEILKWIEDNGSKLVFKGNTYFGTGTVGKAGKKRISPNTQEIMVATLCLMNKNFDTTMSLADAAQLIIDAKDKFNSVEGTTGRAELLDQFNDNFNDLGTAISSANAIRKLSGNITKVYWTGSSWHRDIIGYNPQIGGVKNYNSSDIVVKGNDGIFYGISLKKKASTKAPDPTLINKPITGNKTILTDIIGTSDIDKLEKMKNKFFDGVIAKHYFKKATHTTLASINKMTVKEKNEKINNIPLKTMGTYLKSRENYFYIWADKILTSEAEDFAKKFMELLFRVKLSGVINENEFKFYLLTGIGKKSGQNVVSEPAEVKDLPHAVEAISKINDSTVTMEKTKGKLHAWERSKTGKQATAAKLFYTIYSDRNPIVNLELRYKGSYTANPQFQAVATAVFKNMFK